MMKLVVPLVHIALALSLVLGLALAAAIQPARAAVTCVAYHTVKSSDTTVSISQTYGVKWREILKANKLGDDYELEVGDRLCIPDDGSKVNHHIKDVRERRSRGMFRRSTRWGHFGNVSLPDHRAVGVPLFVQPSVDGDVPEQDFALVRIV